MAKKTVQIDEDLHAQIKTASLKHKMDIQQFVETCLTLFVETDMNPKQMDKMKEMRDTYIGFIRKGEKEFLIPIKHTAHKISEKMVDFEDDLKGIKVILREINTKINK